MTAFCLVDLDESRVFQGHDISIVHFKSITEETILRYIKTGEPMDKAGAYGIQGKGRDLVKSFTGSFENIVGLPIQKLEGVFLQYGWCFRKQPQASAFRNRDGE